MMRHISKELLVLGFCVDLLAATGRLMALRPDPGGFQVVLKSVLLDPIAARQLGLIPALTRHLKNVRPGGQIAARPI